MAPLTLDPAVWVAIGTGATALAAWCGHLLTRRSSREQGTTEARKVDTEDWRAVTDALRQDLGFARSEAADTRARVSALEYERALDRLWIERLREHIYRGSPPPPPPRPTSL